MKRFILALAALLTITVSASAMSYQQARDQALFLTDKMAYELNLTDEQYEAAYEINLDYLMNIDGDADLYGAYWRQRNLDLYYIMSDLQYRSYCAASYFYRPLYWDGSYWHFSIYARYPYRDFFYFGCPDFVVTYRGGHSWYHNGGRSWYYGRDWHAPRDGGRYLGMRTRFDRGNYGDGYRIDRNGTRSWGNGSQRYNNGNNSSNGTRSFGNIRNTPGNDSPLRNRSFGSSSSSTNGSRSFGIPRESSTRSTVNRNSSFSTGGSFGNHSVGTPSNTFSRPSNGTRSYSAPSSSSFGNRSYSAPSNSSSSRSSFGNHSAGGSSFGGGSISAPSTRSSGSSSSHSSGFSGGGQFGRR